jgi:DEAD/DEAH box helicase domain-containing protein
MIPWVVARELRATLLDYLRSTWGIADRTEEAALFRFLGGPQGLFQGPYLRVSLPFAPSPASAQIPLDVAPPYPPHLHQLEAWQRLSSRGREPEPTLVTTGTGSGKTECFLYPLLDHVARANARGEAGIKALVLYPMNALASDQAQRFAETIWNDERLRGRVRVGLFVGGKGQHSQMGRDNVIDVNDRMRADPPDILLTNYRMLDLLLQRPKDARLWAKNAPGTLRYLVLDEVHTYDGAQGTDVACLIRRLGQRLGGAESICPVGTSATVGSGDETRSELLGFASKLFDQAFPEGAFIGETRVTPASMFMEPPLAETYPKVPGPWPAAGDDADEHVRACVRAWFGKADQSAVLDEDRDGSGGIDRVALGRLVIRLPIIRALLSLATRRPVLGPDLVAALAKELPAFGSATSDEQVGWLASALTLLSFAQRSVGKLAMPLASVQVTLWIREVRRLLSRIGDAPAYRFHDDSPPPENEVWVPRYACRDCGHGGWMLIESGPGDVLGVEYRDVARAYQERAPSLRLVHHDASLEDRGEVRWVDANARRLLDREMEGAPRVHVVAVEHADLRCPACDGKDSMFMLAARGTTLSSVAVGHLFTSPLNTDRKLLTFSDSVQDAAHRAGFFGARTYRFVVRSALYAAVPEEGSVPLAELSARAWEYWEKKIAAEERGRSPIPRLAATLLPPDMHWLSSVEQWHGDLDDYMQRRRRAEDQGEDVTFPVPEPSQQMLDDLRVRMRWEATRELGLAARVGRTLEQSACVSLTVDEARFEKATKGLAERLSQQLGLLLPLSEGAARAFVAGIITRLRLRGGVWDPLLEPYIESGGNSYLLSKERAPLLSPFGPQSTRPLFLTNAPKGKNFDLSASMRSDSWARDWASRALGVTMDAALAAKAYAFTLPALVQAGILISRNSSEKAAVQGNATVYGLAPEVLLVSRAHVFRTCDACGYSLAAVKESVTDPLGHPCSRFRCAGHFVVAKEDGGDLPGMPTADYYRRTYDRGSLGRLWSREHTGLLPRGPREELELEFKQRPRPDSPNLLSCTPTLEMGIDIGDLSATLLCSVPPNNSNYVQRVGRAGRKTGNALVLAFAATKAHDLYFFTQPMEAMAGTIHPPGCYLSAPEVLKRQALAFVFDGFAREGGKAPGRVGDVLRGEGPPFPKGALEYFGAHREKLKTAFNEMFRGHLTSNARRLMEDSFNAGADGLSPLERGLAQTVEDARQRRDDLRGLIKKIDERKKQLDVEQAQQSTPAEEIVEERARLGDERRFLDYQLKALVDKDLWGWLTEESCLPNYAFPERGVKLDAYIRREGATRDPEHHEWIRAPAAALRELAPFNTFYASSRRVRIDGVTLAKEATPVEWLFCRSCHHTEPRNSAAPEETRTQCPRCGDTRWADVGLRRSVMPMSQVYAISRHRDAVLGDDADERSRAFYETVALFEPQADARDAWANESIGFGFELQPQLMLRELNLGQKDDGASSQPMVIAGQSLKDVAFVLCETCGQAQLPDGKQLAVRRDKHRSWCSERRKPDDKQRFRKVHLLRELTSEALRLVLPLSDAVDTNAQTANLRAALRLGLRRFFGGEPDFLDVRPYDEPLSRDEGRRRYLVVMDRVPGGTGLLAELAKNKGEKLKEALEAAHDSLRRCPCQHREPKAKACYQCLYAYRENEDLLLLDRAEAIELVERVLSAFKSLTQVESIGTMNQSSVLESELEKRFLVVLRERVQGAGGTFAQAEGDTWKLTVGTRAWLLRPQVPLGQDVAEVPCQPDFVLYPDGQEAAVPPMAIFVDGLAYHVEPDRPTARLADDARKRLGISRGGKMLSWSMTWKDVVSPELPAVPKWVGDGTPFAQLQQMAFKLDESRKNGVKIEPLLRVLDADPMRALVAWLGAPLGLDDLGRLATFTLLRDGRRKPLARVDLVQETWRHGSEPEELTGEDTSGDICVAQKDLGEHARLLCDVAVARLGKLVTDPEGPRLTLRLADGATARKSPTFELSWRLWLRAWNLLQTLPGAVLVTESGATSLPPPPLEQPATKPTTKPPAPIADDPRLAAALEIGDAHAAVVVTELLRADLTLEAPVVPFELRRPAYDVDADVELAWPARKVAAYFDGQKDAAAVLVKAGFTVFAIERKLVLEDLVKALRR